MEKLVARIIEEFDECISDAPLDFMGTGSRASARLEEESWSNDCNRFRERVREILVENSTNKDELKAAANRILDPPWASISNADGKDLSAFEYNARMLAGDYIGVKDTEDQPATTEGMLK